MSNTIETEHNENIIKQFSKQAVSFSKVKGHYDSVETIIAMSEVSQKDEVLDIACGVGILSCEFAKYAKSVIGVDITQKMLDVAIQKQSLEKLKNIRFTLGNVQNLHYADNSFDIVFTRYSFHHFLDTKKVFTEMLRVCKPQGKIIVVDVALEGKYADRYNFMEKLRDPSHTKALTFEEFDELFAHKSLSNHQQSSYSVPMELEKQLEASFPNEGDEEKLREIFKNDLKTNSLGLHTSLKENKIYFSYPITIFIAEKL